MGRNGIPLLGGQGSMSKLKSGQVAVWATRTLMDLVGPFAYTSECPLEKWFRDAKIYELFEGTAEIQRLVISRMQVAEYRERLIEAAAIAAEGTEPAARRLGRDSRRVRPRQTRNTAATPLAAWDPACRKAVSGIAGCPVRHHFGATPLGQLELWESSQTPAIPCAPRSSWPCSP